MKHKSILKYILMISAATSMMSCNGDAGQQAVRQQHVDDIH